MASSRILAIGAVAVVFLLTFSVMTSRAHRTSKDGQARERSRHLKADQEPSPAPHEPPGDVVRKLEFQRYEEIEKAGGLPVTITATGKSLVLHPKLYEVRKDSCVPVVYRPGAYECHLTIKVSLEPDGSDPKEQGERIGVRWQDGEWVQD